MEIKDEKNMVSRENDFKSKGNSKHKSDLETKLTNFQFSSFLGLGFSTLHAGKYEPLEDMGPIISMIFNNYSEERELKKIQTSVLNTFLRLRKVYSVGDLTKKSNEIYFTCITGKPIRSKTGEEIGKIVRINCDIVYNREWVKAPLSLDLLWGGKGEGNSWMSIDHLQPSEVQEIQVQVKRGSFVKKYFIPEHLIERDEKNGLYFNPDQNLKCIYFEWIHKKPIMSMDGKHNFGEVDDIIYKKEGGEITKIGIKPSFFKKTKYISVDMIGMKNGILYIATTHTGDIPFDFSYDFSKEISLKTNNKGYNLICANSVLAPDLSRFIQKGVSNNQAPYDNVLCVQYFTHSITPKYIHNLEL